MSPGLTPADQQALEKVYDIGVGEYDLVFDMGPSFRRRQDQEAQWMLQLVQAEPGIMQVAGDIVVGAQDSPGAKELAKRLKKALPPNLQDDNDPSANLQKAQSQLQAMSQQHELLTAELNKAHDIIQQKQIEQQGKYAIEELHAHTQITVAEITTKAQHEKFRLQLEHDAEMQFHAQAHDVALSTHEHGQSQDLADQQAANSSAQSTQDAAQSQAQPEGTA